MVLKTHNYIGKQHSVEPFSLIQTFNTVTYLDESFMSRGRWEIINQEEWLVSLVCGHCMTPLILVDIRKCREHCIPNTNGDWEYFNDLLLSGYKYITCDGWNRNTTSYAWNQNKVKLRKGIYMQEGGYPLEITKDSYKNQLDPHQQSVIDSLIVPIAIIYKATREDLGKIFVSVNKNVEQNPMELRQALKTDIAKPIRDLATKLQDYFLATYKSSPKSKEEQLLSTLNCNRRLHDEFILDCVMYVHTKFAKNWTKGTRDMYYSREKSDLLTSYKYAETIITKMMKSGTTEIKNKNNKVIGHTRSFKINDMRSLFQNFVLRVELENDECVIKDNIKFDKWVQQHHVAWINSKNPPKMIQYESDGVTLRKVFTYKSASRRSPDQVSWTTSLFISKLNEINDIISHEPKDKKRLYSLSDKLEMWKIQGGVAGQKPATCPETNDKIPLEELFDTRLWQADHIIPHSKQGETSIENGRIISAVANAAKSNKLPEGKVLGSVLSSKIASSNDNSDDDESPVFSDFFEEIPEDATVETTLTEFGKKHQLDITKKAFDNGEITAEEYKEHVMNINKTPVEAPMTETNIG